MFALLLAIRKWAMRCNIGGGDKTSYELFRLEKNLVTFVVFDHSYEHFDLLPASLGLYSSPYSGGMFIH